MRRSAGYGHAKMPRQQPRKKTAAAIRKEIAREVDQLLGVVFNGRRKAGRVDLEAIEMAVRSAMHRAGAAALTELLQFAVQAAEQRNIPCSCGHQAHYRQLRSKALLTAVGKVEVSRPYYLCPHCHSGQFPADIELDVENTEISPGVRRMQVVVGQDAPFDHGRQQMKLLADLEVTTKAVERTAEAIGEDIAAREQEEIRRAMQLDLPMIVFALARASRFPCCMCKWTAFALAHRSARGEKGNRGPARQDGRATGAHSGGQAGMCVHANEME